MKSYIKIFIILLVLMLLFFVVLLATSKETKAVHINQYVVYESNPKTGYVDITLENNTNEGVWFYLTFEVYKEDVKVATKMVYYLVEPYGKLDRTVIITSSYESYDLTKSRVVLASKVTISA